MKILLQDYAYEKCRELIQSGELISGQLYSEVALSRDLDISRTPLRSAIQRLEKEGLVTRLPQRGFQVNQFSIEDIQELFDIRKAIEGFAVETLALKGGGPELTELKRYIRLQDQKTDNGEENLRPFLETDREFHETLVHALKNSRLVEMYADLRQSIALSAMKRFKLTGQRSQSLSEHRDIIGAIEARDPVAARKAIYRHIDSALELIKQESV